MEKLIIKKNEIGSTEKFNISKAHAKLDCSLKPITARLSVRDYLKVVELIEKTGKNESSIIKELVSFALENAEVEN